MMATARHSKINARPATAASEPVTSLEPDRFQRRILVCVSGLTPQIVTETLYALATMRPRAFVPTEIRLITTKEGAERARLTLLSEDPGWFHRLVAELDLGAIRFDTDTIHTICDREGRELTDIRTPSDNEAAADFITESIRRWTADQNAAVHVSLAGGRKTMGFYVAYALSLYGRTQDRLSHVLVSQEFEGLHDFYYPTIRPRIIYDRNKKPLDTRNAAVTLAEIPFVRLRHGLPERLLEGTATFSTTVMEAQRTFAPPQLTIDVAARTVCCTDHEVPMSPVDLAFLLWLASRRKNGQPPVERSDGDVSEFLSCYSQVVGPVSGLYERVCRSLGDNMTEDYFDEHKSRVNGALRRTLGTSGCQPYLIVGEGARPSTRFGLLRLSPDAIFIRTGQAGDTATDIRKRPHERTTAGATRTRNDTPPPAVQANKERMQ